MVHICMGSIKGHCWLLWDVTEIISCSHWNLLLRKARILIVRDGSWHVSEIE